MAIRFSHSSDTYTFPPRSKAIDVGQTIEPGASDSPVSIISPPKRPALPISPM